MRIITTHSDTIEPELYQKLLKFVQDIAREDSKGMVIQNMGLDSEAGMLHNIKSKRRWTQEKGEISLLVTGVDDTIIGTSCVEHTKIDLLSIGGIRTWVMKPYRSKNVVTSMMLQSNLDWSTANNKAGMLMTFNKYNHWIYDGIRKKISGRGAGLASVWSDWWNDCMAVDEPVRIRNVEQWCVIKPTGLHGNGIVKSIVENIDVIG